VIVLQRAAPTEAGVNWLPTPAGRFRINLRLYLPERSVWMGAGGRRRCSASAEAGDSGGRAQGSVSDTTQARRR
jgi:hypothetical protein